MREGPPRRAPGQGEPNKGVAEAQKRAVMCCHARPTYTRRTLAGMTGTRASHARGKLERQGGAGPWVQGTGAGQRAGWCRPERGKVEAGRRAG